MGSEGKSYTLHHLPLSASQIRRLRKSSDPVSGAAFSLHQGSHGVLSHHGGPGTLGDLLRLTVHSGFLLSLPCLPEWRWKTQHSLPTALPSTHTKGGSFIPSFVQAHSDLSRKRHRKHCKEVSKAQVQPSSHTV